MFLKVTIFHLVMSFLLGIAEKIALHACTINDWYVPPQRPRKKRGTTLEELFIGIRVLLIRRQRFACTDAVKWRSAFSLFLTTSPRPHHFQLPFLVPQLLFVRNLSLPLSHGHILCPFQSDTTKYSPPSLIRMETYHLPLYGESFVLFTMAIIFLQFFNAAVFAMVSSMRPVIFVSVTCSDFCNKNFFLMEPSPT